jgi:coatomer protein complex subunit alpha (xenin)
VQDQQTRFDLAIECGNLQVALEMAKAVDREDVWNKLAGAALKSGNHQVSIISPFLRIAGMPR